MWGSVGFGHVGSDVISPTQDYLYKRMRKISRLGKQKTEKRRVSMARYRIISLTESPVY